MNVLTGEAMFPRSRWPLPCGAGAALMVLADTGVTEFEANWEGGQKRGKLEVTSSFLQPAADMTYISQ